MELYEAGMQQQPPGAAVTPGQTSLLARTWQGTLVLGILTLVLGLVVAFHPTGSLNVVAVLLGILMIISGIFHLLRVFGLSEQHRVWLGIAGVAFIVVGVVLIRHLHLTLAVIGLIIGIDWIIQGLISVIAGLSSGSGEGRGWWIFFGIVSLLAGIVVVSTPVSSLTVLAVLLGIWFIVLGLLEVVGSFLLRHAQRSTRSTMASTIAGSAGAGA